MAKCSFSKEETSPSDNYNLVREPRDIQTREHAAKKQHFPGIYCLVLGQLKPVTYNNSHLSIIKCAIFYAENAEIFKKIYEETLSMARQSDLKLLVAVSPDDPSTYCPKINVNKSGVQLTCGDMKILGQNSHTVRITIQNQTQKFTMEALRKPNNTLKGVTEWRWPTESIGEIIPSGIWKIPVTTCNNIVEMSFTITVNTDIEHKSLTFVVPADVSSQGVKSSEKSCDSGRSSMNKRRKLSEDLNDVLRSLNVTMLIDKLCKYNILNDQDQLNLKSNKEISYRINELQRILLCIARNPNVRQSLIDMLEESDVKEHQALANILTKYSVMF